MLKHNKKKNSQIIYEQLISLATRLAMTKNPKESKYILSIIKEHFALSTELGKERKLFDAILRTEGASKEEAEAILNETLKEAERMRTKPLEREKNILINRIINEVGVELFALPIKDYKLLASIQILFNETRNGFRHTRPRDRVKVKNLLVENMITNPQTDDLEEMDNFTYKILVSKFNEKYDTIMNKQQKEILSEWVKYLTTDDEAPILSEIAKKRKMIRKEIKNSLINKKHRNSDYGIMLEEAVSSLNSPIKGVTEDLVYETIKYFDLLEDLNEIKEAKQVQSL